MHIKLNADNERYKSVQNQINKLIADTQKANQRVEIDRILKDKNKEFFKYVKRLREPNKKNNDSRLDAEQTTNTFHFSRIRKKKQEQKLESVSFSTKMPELTNSMLLFPLGTSENFETIQSLNNSTAESIDGLNKVFLNLSSPVQSEYLSVSY